MVFPVPVILDACRHPIVRNKNIDVFICSVVINALKRRSWEFGGTAAQDSQCFIEERSRQQSRVAKTAKPPAYCAGCGHGSS